MARRKKETWKTWLSILALVWLIFFILRQDYVSDKIAPSKGDKVRMIANNGMWITLGAILLIIALTVLTGPVALLLGVIGGLLIVVQGFQLWDTLTTPTAQANESQ